MKYNLPQGKTHPSVEHRNSIGALRLLFASLVIVFHSSLLITGNMSGDPLMKLTGTINFGQLGVYGFFVISGYLITASFMSAPGVRDFAIKRVLRIYPAYLVAFALCAFVVAPLAGGDLSKLANPGGIAHLAYDALTLDEPRVPDAFAATQMHALNKSMWTISYEFRCYILAAVAGLAGLYRRPRLYLAITVAFLGLSFFADSLPNFMPLKSITGWTKPLVTLIAAFMCGGCFRLLPVKFTAPRAAVAFVACAALIRVPHVADVAIWTLGAYVIFWVGFSPWLKPINGKADISYGTYLYGWPIGALLLLSFPGIVPPVLFAATLPLALLAGFLSWHLIEKRALALKPRALQQIRPAARWEFR